MHIPNNSYDDPSVIPRGLKWARESRGKKEGGKDLTTYRLFLDQMTKEQVNLKLFDGFIGVSFFNVIFLLSFGINCR